MTDRQIDKPDNLVRLDRSPFSKKDTEKIKAVGDKQKLLYRWFRCERLTQEGLDRFVLYSGARGRTPYAAYRVERYGDGRYKLADQRTDEALAEGRTLDAVLDKLPDDFFYSI